MPATKKKIFVDYEIARQFMTILDGDAEALADMQRQQKIPGTPIHTLTEHFNLRHAVLDAQDVGEVTAELLRKLFHYDPDTGIFTRLTASHTWKTGTVAGTPLKDGHIRMLVGRKNYLAHRLAFLYMTGSMPSNVVDHINGDPADNRFCNLRDVDFQFNSQNRRKPGIKNTTGFLGVHLVKGTGKFRAQLKIHPKTIILGDFDAPETAHEAYLDAKRKLHKGNTL